MSSLAAEASTGQERLKGAPPPQAQSWSRPLGDADAGPSPVAEEVAAWLDWAVEEGRSNPEVHAAALAVLARAGAATYEEDLVPSQDALLDSLKARVASLRAREEPALVQHAQEELLSERLGGIGATCANLDLGDAATPLTQQPHVAFLDPDVYPVLDRLATTAGFDFTEIGCWNLLALFSELLAPSLEERCSRWCQDVPISARKTTVIARSAAMIATADSENYYETVRENSGPYDFERWQTEVSYDPEEELGEGALDAWRRGIRGSTQALVKGAPVLDALSVTVVVDTPEQLAAVWERLVADCGGGDAVLRVSSPFAGRQQSSGEVPREDPYFRTTAHVLLESDRAPTIADALTSQRGDVEAAMDRAKRLTDGSDVDAAVQILDGLLGEIGQRKLAMVVEVVLMLDFYSRSLEEPGRVLWSLIEEAQDLYGLESLCEGHMETAANAERAAAAAEDLAVSVDKEKGLLGVDR